VQGLGNGLAKNGMSVVAVREEKASARIVRKNAAILCWWDHPALLLPRLEFVFKNAANRFVEMLST